MTAFGPPIESDAATAPFFAAAARDELVLPRCASCGGWYPPEVTICCGALEWAAAAGHGILVTWAVVHTAPHPAFASLLPFRTALVELAEGPWLQVRLVGPGEPAAGCPVRITFAHPAEGASYPVGTLEGP
ncbi:Zn-ribbon domain-containing OB-fold protein [Pseudonocardia ailaonensis]|uniref:Zn-ribbon domain-containing OB-fold protein n=1 Tax=Pseudonocardia ailaonensis TaxID=367279 RepID=A0ABN2MUE0_9PSEU